jgi:hypothetical protein
VVIGIVAFAQSVSLAVLMAKKHHYDIDANKVKYKNLRKIYLGICIAPTQPFGRF